MINTFQIGLHRVCNEAQFILNKHKLDGSKTGLEIIFLITK